MKALATVAAIALAFGSALAQTYSFGVKVVGHGKPVILIPGLTCTGEIWNGMVERLKSKYECHVLTLPGFGTQPPIEGPYLSHVRDDVVAYVKDRKLDHPAVIGHSLGGFMVFYLGVKEPKLFGPLIAVDGLPFLSVVFNPNATVETAKPIAEMIAKQISTSTPAQFKANIKATLGQEITDPKNVEKVMATSELANPTDTAQAMKEMMTTDLRGEVSKIESPVLLIGAGSPASTDAQRKTVTQVYSAQIKPIHNSKLEMDWRSKHFVMLDDPVFLYKTVEDFLAAH